MTHNRRPCAVVFDLDGLMFNTEDLYQEVGTRMLQRRGKSFDAELLDGMMGQPANAALQLMIDYHGLEATVDELMAETDAVFATLLEGRLEQMPGLACLLDAIEQAGIPKAIATSSGPAFVRRVLDHFDLRPRFEFVLTCEDVRQGKPHPEIYLLAASRLAVSPLDMLVLEDSQNGARAAVDSGAMVVAVPGGHSLRHQFPGVLFIADSLADARLYGLLGIEAGDSR